MAQIRVILTDKEKTQILTDAIESLASGYWMESAVVVERDKDYLILSAHFWAFDKMKKKQGYEIKPYHIQMGVDRLMNPKFVVSDGIRKAIAEQNWDADVYDCILQAICFNEIVYG